MPDKSLEGRILTLHPDGKNGVRISLSRYNLMCDTLFGIFAETQEISYKELSRIVEERLNGMIDGSILWLMETVKLDLLARGILEKTSDHPVRLRIVGKQSLSCFHFSDLIRFTFITFQILPQSRQGLYIGNTTTKESF
jgi:hypothetical protein